MKSIIIGCATDELERQRQEAIIGCNILNKMTCISLAEIRSKF
jgi:hypothetical protein